jgi:hypothetical protein
MLFSVAAVAEAEVAAYYLPHETAWRMRSTMCGGMSTDCPHKGLRHDRACIVHKRIAFPMANRVAIECVLHVRWMTAPVGIVAAQAVAVELAEDRHGPWVNKNSVELRVQMTKLGGLQAGN